MSFPLNILNAYCISGKGHVNSLDIVDNDVIVDILPNAFAGTLFSKMRHLGLTALRLNYLRAGIFNGLNELSSLSLQHMNLLIVDANILKTCRNLQYLGITYNSSCDEQALWLENITGSDPLTLTALNIGANRIRYAITNKSFKGLTELVTLNLARNQIEYIGEKSFDIFARTLIYLDLEDNLLTTISPVLFGSLLHQPLTQIVLVNNPLHCNCSLESLKKLVRNYSAMFPGTIECSTPLMLTGKTIQEAELCAVNHTDPNSMIVKKCGNYPPEELLKFVTIAMKKRDKVIRLHKMADKNFHITIDNFPIDHILLWYENGKLRCNSNSMQCMLNRNGTNTRNITINEIWPLNKVHTLCMKPKQSFTINPLNCISFDTFKRTDHSVEMWLPKSYRFAAIVLSIIACFVCLIIGVAIVFLLAKYCPKSAQLNNRNATRVDEPFSVVGNGTVDCLPYYDPVWKFNTQSEYLRWHIDNYRVSSTRRSSDNPPPLPPPNREHLKKRFQKTAINTSQNISERHHYESI